MPSADAFAVCGSWRLCCVVSALWSICGSLLVCLLPARAPTKRPIRGMHGTKWRVRELMRRPSPCHLFPKSNYPHVGVRAAPQAQEGTSTREQRAGAEWLPAAQVEGFLRTSVKTSAALSACRGTRWWRCVQVRLRSSPASHAPPFPSPPPPNSPAPSPILSLFQDHCGASAGR